jgi:hypothetical protein
MPADLSFGEQVITFGKNFLLKPVLYCLLCCCTKRMIRPDMME